MTHTTFWFPINKSNSYLDIIREKFGKKVKATINSIKRVNGRMEQVPGQVYAVVKIQNCMSYAESRAILNAVAAIQF